MFQILDGIAMEVVEFDTMPKLPITGLTREEQVYYNLVGRGRDDLQILRKMKYAEALTNAIETGVITEPGKYGIHIVPGEDRYEIYKITEP